MRIIVVLGSPNDDFGNLCQMAISRCKKCVDIYKPSITKLVLTGGFGPHFNTTDKPHWQYLQNYLVKKGVLETDVIAGTLARHSVEDATLLIPVLEKINPRNITIITSDYHVERAKIIFEAVFKGKYNFQYQGANSQFCDKNIIEKLIEHEVKAVADLLENGVRF